MAKRTSNKLKLPDDFLGTVWAFLNARAISGLVWAAATFVIAVIVWASWRFMTAEQMWP